MREIREYREALAKFCKGDIVMSIPVQSNDADVILKEAIDGLEVMYEACLSALGALSTVEATNMTNVAMENLRQALRKAKGRTDRG